MKAVDVRNIDDLKKVITNGELPSYYLFWVGPMSQWHPSSFTVDGVKYLTAEHWMMAGKARMFNDAMSEQQILMAKTPKEAKAIGRSVRGFDKDTWEENCFDLVVRGNIEKFSQSPRLMEDLLSTEDVVLVEASPYDRIWGIGLSEKAPEAKDPFRWRGTNYLGFALMEARAQLKK